MKTLILLLTIIIFIGCSENKNKQSTEEQVIIDLKLDIEKKTSVHFPDFEAINMEYGSMGFNGDYSNTMLLKFKENADLENFYKEIKNQIENPQELNYEKINDCCTVLIDEWRISTTGEYSYYSLIDCSDGNDKSFDLRIHSKDSTVELSYGRW